MKQDTLLLPFAEAAGRCAMWYCKQALDKHHSGTSAMPATLWLQICAAGAAVALRKMTMDMPWI